MSLTDEIVAQARTGDATAVEAIYCALAPKVLGYLSVRGTEDPEALTNDVFVAVIPRLSTVEGGVVGLRRFVFSVAHRRFVDEVRRRDRRPRHVPYEPEDDPRNDDPAETLAVSMVSFGEMSGHMRRLTSDQRAVVSLRVLGDLSLAETAEVLGRSVGSVKQLQRRALESLRHMMEEAGVRDG